MEIVFDAARDFRMFALHKAEAIDFSIPAKIVFNKRQDQNVEVGIGSKRKGNFEISFDSGDFNFFSPPESLVNPFETLFNYYFSHIHNQKLAGHESGSIYIILPLFFSMDVEHIIANAVMESKPVIYRDIEVYSAYYLNESIDLPELKHFAENDGGAHVYGNILTGGSICSFLINFLPDAPPEIIDFTRIEDSADFLNTLRFNIIKHSTRKPGERSSIFYFIEQKVLEKLGTLENEKAFGEFEKEIEKDINIPFRSLRKKEGENPFISGVLHLNEKPETAPIFKYFLFTQDSGTSFSRIIPGKAISLLIDFYRDIPGEFFINLFIGPNNGNLILLKRLFLDMENVKEKHVELKAKCEMVKTGLNYTFIFKDKIYKEVLIPLKAKYHID
ncbi:MAG: hypothetical protein MUF15_07880 [Acidobacteria bacterium]|jgi:hypothetical protein|nr:hypothetical protein [Acidobacteriota bacterium]